MLQRWLPFLLIVLIALQSVAALANGHLLCQDERPHNDATLNHDDLATSENFLQPPVTHLATASIALEDICQDPTQDSDDCHHCGHCHGHFSSALAPHFATLSLRHTASLIPNYIAGAHPLVVSRFLRPPIV